jgi:hypothetical protein
MTAVDTSAFAHRYDHTAPVQALPGSGSDPLSKIRRTSGLLHGDCAGRNLPLPQRSGDAVQGTETEFGHPAASMRFSTAAPTAASVRRGGVAACMQPRPDDRLVAPHRCLDQRAAGVAGLRGVQGAFGMRLAQNVSEAAIRWAREMLTSETGRCARSGWRRTMCRALTRTASNGRSSRLCHVVFASGLSLQRVSLRGSKLVLPERTVAPPAGAVIRVFAGTRCAELHRGLHQDVASTPLRRRGLIAHAPT